MDGRADNGGCCNCVDIWGSVGNVGAVLELAIIGGLFGCPGCRFPGIGLLAALDDCC